MNRMFNIPKETTMKKLILIPTLVALAACGTCTAPSVTAEHTCLERGYSKGTSKYDHCIVDEQQAAKLAKENNDLIK